MRISLHPGVYVGSIGLWLMGGLAMMGAVLPTQLSSFRLGEVAVAAGILLFIWGIKWDGQHWWHLAWSSATYPFPERHKQILQSLADTLAEVQNLSLAKAYWNPQTHHALRQEHLGKLADARSRAENLNEQIPYDPATMQTVRDFLHAAQIVVHDALQNWDDRESRSDLDRIAAGLFFYLHDGKAVNRRKIDLPDWCRVTASAKADRPVLEVQAPSYDCAQPVKSEFEDEWDYITAKERGEHIKRDKPLNEALAYAARGQWDANYFDVVSAGEDREAEQLRRFQQAAYDGKLRVWGKRQAHADLYEEIPRNHWRENRVEWFDLLRGKPRTEPRGQAGEPAFYDLMVSRAEIERELPYER
jgi:hypothetical protein